MVSKHWDPSIRVFVLMQSFLLQGAGDAAQWWSMDLACTRPCTQPSERKEKSVFHAAHVIIKQASKGSGSEESTETQPRAEDGSMWLMDRVPRRNAVSLPHAGNLVIQISSYEWPFCASYKHENAQQESGTRGPIRRGFREEQQCLLQRPHSSSAQRHR